MHYATVLEGSARHTGVHAAGVIIAPGDVSEYVPVSVAKSKGDDVVTTQYDGSWVESFGLLKMDFLGLKTLTVIHDAVEMVKARRGLVTDARLRTQCEQAGAQRSLPTAPHRAVILNEPSALRPLPGGAARMQGIRSGSWAVECGSPLHTLYIVVDPGRDAHM